MTPAADISQPHSGQVFSFADHPGAWFEGDYAQGQRTVRDRLPVSGDFATGMRASPKSPMVGDFATGMRTSSITATRGDFATGMRTKPVGVVRLAAENGRESGRSSLSIAA